MKTINRIAPVILIQIFLLYTGPALAATIHVPTDQPTIQAGINAAVGGDLVLVAPGTYEERIRFLGKAVTVRSDADGLSDTYDIDPEATVMQGGAMGSVVTFWNRETEASVLDGFTVTNGSGTFLSEWDAPCGGGVLCYFASPTIRNCKIAANNADWGGGLFCKLSSASIVDCEIASNNAQWGGGVYSEQSVLRIELSTIMANTAEGGGGVVINEGFPTITGCTISGNSAEPYGNGGGIYINYSWATIINCTIEGNSVSYSAQGSGVYCYGSSPTMENCSVSENNRNGIYLTEGSSPLIESCVIAENSYSGISCYSGSSPTIRECTITGNTSPYSGGGIRCSGAETICTIESCTISGNIATYSHSYSNGGGIAFQSDAGGTVVNSMIFDNSASDRGGGIYCSYSDPMIAHCTIVDNFALGETEGGGGIYCQGSPRPTITNCIFWNNWAQDGSQIISFLIDVTYSDVQMDTPDAVWLGEGNINAFPYFREDFSLPSDSPCVDTGTDAGVYTDMKGDPRPFGAGFDMGADESIFVCMDEDGDGYDDADCGGCDCDDADPAVSPGAEEICDNGIDDDCDGWIDSEDVACLASISVPGEYGTIQEAIDAAMEGHTILVAPGTYVENINFLGKAITLRSDLDGDPWTEDLSAETTVIDGNQSESVVIFDNFEGSDSIIRGFTVKNGKDLSRGGIYCGRYTFPTIENCTITENICETSSGGGILCEDGATIINCTISNNRAKWYGAGICFWFSSIPSLVKGCVIEDNIADYHGGGLACIDTTVSVVNCVISGNSAERGGGGLYSWQRASLYLENTLITGNMSGSSGGALFSDDSASNDLLNCTFSDNHGTSHGGAIRGTWSAEVAVANCIFWDNYAPDGPQISLSRATATVRFSDIQGGEGPIHVDSFSELDWQEGNLDEDPLFADYLEYRLGEGSPCIDAGDPEPIYYDWCFPPSMGGERNDMGAYGGFKACGWFPCFDDDGDGYKDLACGGDDCDDTDPQIHPEALEACDGIDDDCDGLTDEDFDLDGDGFSPCALPVPDCDDVSPEIYPGAPETCDGLDNDCDGSIPPDELDLDGDGFLACLDDCDDTDPEVNPHHEEVPDNGVDDNCNGHIDEPWATIWVPEAHITVQEGIGAAEDGDVVMVAPGTYTGTIDFQGKAITLRSEWGPEETVIDGKQAGPGVVFTGGEGEETVLEGFTIRNGSGLYVPETGVTIGGGIVCGEGTSPTLINCTIAENGATNGGGLYLNEDSTARIEGCSIERNWGESGAGIFCYRSSPIIEGCEIFENAADQTGAGVACVETASPAIHDTSIFDNVAQIAGGGIACLNSASPQLDECTLLTNSAESGGGLHSDATSWPVIGRCTVSENSAAEGGGLYYAGGSLAVIEASTLSGNQATSGAGIFLVDASPTIIGCGISGNEAESVGGGILCSGLASPTIDSGTFVENEAAAGGAILCTDQSLSLIESCTFTLNRAGSGGSIACQIGASPSIQDCSFNENSASYGGALYFEDQSSPIITDCFFVGNRAEDESGGAIACEEEASLVCDRCAFVRNLADKKGGGIYFDWQTGKDLPYVYLTNCTFHRNKARYERGGAIYGANDTNGSIENCTFSANTAMDRGGAICLYNSNAWALVNVILWGDQAKQGPEIALCGDACLIVKSSDVQGGEAAVYDEWSSTLLWLNGTLDVDPRFVSEDDLHLSFGSPCIDAGSIVEVEADIDGEPRPLGEGYDMGSDEYPAGCHDLDGDGFGDAACGGHDCDDAAPGVSPRIQEDCGNGIDDDCDGAVDSDDPDCVFLYIPSDHPTIKSAIEAALDGDVILVAPGTYYESGIDFLGKEITIRSEAGAEHTVIDGDHEGRVLQFISGETRRSILDGFTIRRGRFNQGPGIFCQFSSPTITNCHILGNIAYDFYSYGGGVYCYMASPKVTNCIISENEATNGGGIYCTEDSSPKIINSIIANNEADYGGGLHCVYSSSPEILFCTISENSAEKRGGGIYSRESSLSITNSILWGNSAPESPEIYVYLGSPAVTYSDIQGGWPGEGNIDSDPLFAGEGDYHITTGSPCIDAGIDTGVHSDIDGGVRPQGGGFDMGADEYCEPGFDGDEDGSDACFDCNDGVPDTYPGAPEICDGADNDCDGVVPAGEMDGDGDGWRICEGDCNDSEAQINPGHEEVPGNGVDDDCDGLIDEGCFICSILALS